MKLTRVLTLIAILLLIDITPAFAGLARQEALGAASLAVENDGDDAVTLHPASGLPPDYRFSLFGGYEELSGTSELVPVDEVNYDGEVDSSGELTEFGAAFYIPLHRVERGAQPSGVSLGYDRQNLVSEQGYTGTLTTAEGSDYSPTLYSYLSSVYGISRFWAALHFAPAEIVNLSLAITQMSEKVVIRYSDSQLVGDQGSGSAGIYDYEGDVFYPSLYARFDPVEYVSVGVGYTPEMVSSSKGESIQNYSDGDSSQSEKIQIDGATHVSEQVDAAVSVHTADQSMRLAVGLERTSPVYYDVFNVGVDVLLREQQTAVSGAFEVDILDENAPLGLVARAGFHSIKRRDYERLAPTIGAGVNIGPVFAGISAAFIRSTAEQDPGSEIGDSDHSGFAFGAGLEAKFGAARWAAGRPSTGTAGDDGSHGRITGPSETILVPGVGPSTGQDIVETETERATELEPKPELELEPESEPEPEPEPIPAPAARPAPVPQAPPVAPAGVHVPQITPVADPMGFPDEEDEPAPTPEPRRPAAPRDEPAEVHVPQVVVPTADPVE